MSREYIIVNHESSRVLQNVVSTWIPYSGLLESTIQRENGNGY